jgi:hypothetical protein
MADGGTYGVGATVCVGGADRGGAVAAGAEHAVATLMAASATKVARRLVIGADRMACPT